MKPGPCDWCGTLTDRADGFCSVECSRKWLREDRNAEFAAEAAMDAAIDAGLYDDAYNDDDEDNVDVEIEFDDDMGRD